MLTAFSIVREKERRTLEQLFVTPVRPLGLMMGKIMPYFAWRFSHLVPATYMMDISRGVILRGAGLADLAASAAVLFTMGALILLLAAKRFTKMVV